MIVNQFEIQTFDNINGCAMKSYTKQLNVNQTHKKITNKCISGKREIQKEEVSFIAL